MSFILDALRKSEHERQRQTGPALVETPVATPKPKSNVWATAAIALLVVTVVKAFLHDTWSLGGLYRVGSLVGLAVSLAAVAVALQRFVLRKTEAE